MKPHGTRSHARPALAGLTLALCLLAALPASAPARHGAVAAKLAGRDPLAPYRGMGAWISLYSKGWNDPAGAVRSLAARKVTTLYLETGRSTSPGAIERPAPTMQFIQEAHAAGMSIVAWYYPTFVKWSVDAQRTLQTALFRTPDGQAFDGVAPDIEDPAVKSASLRTARLIAYTNRLHAELPAYQWGAITYPPIGLDLNPGAWRGFPWAFVANRYVTILPMAYWRYRTRTAAGAAWYAAGNLAALRVLTGRSDVAVHMIGSGGTTAAEAYAFAQASSEGGAIGVSLYPADRLGGGEWSALLRAQPSSAS
jgi:hypothetical protein